MSVSPSLIVLYDTDVVEVRYTDGSRLELSPCGSTMIYQPPPIKGEHPRQGLTKRVHKRTCFVTSDHKQFVLQALDFRNRFAERPYLCEELLNKEDIVMLYATVDSIQWPECVEGVHVKILEDGSRKVTSLDDFASLIVSPHGQDFSISYLSMISPEGKFMDSRQQLSHYTQSSLVSHSFHQDKVQKVGDKKNEAVVQPFSHEIQMHQGPHISRTQSDMEDQTGFNAKITKNMQTSLEKNAVEQNGGGSSVVAGVDKTLRESPTSHFEVNESHVGIGDEGPEKTKDRAAFIYDSDHGNHSVISDQMESVNPGSSIAHDISSISRSSTPDGLRTTIDSDATLINDQNECEGIPVQNTVYKHQRHSSPTHASSPCDVQQPFRINNIQLNREQAGILDGSFLECNSKINRQPPNGLDNSNDADNSKVEELNKVPPNCMQNLRNDLELALPTLKSHVKSGSSNASSLQDAYTTKGSVQTSCNITIIPKRSEHCENNSYSNDNGSVVMCDQSKRLITPTTTEAPNQSLQPQLRFPANSLKHISHLNRDDQQKETESIVQLPSTIINERHSSEDQKSFQHVNHYLSLSNNAKESGGETACRKKYIWMTSHVSRNNCPKEWTHPLMLALQGRDCLGKGLNKVDSPRKSRVSHRSIPKPLPVTCPLQHTHRTSSHPACHNNSDNIDSELSLNIGEFQQGRIKVVLSEGIIYRLTASNEMTLVEVYPGDGTVLVSQGVKAIFFTHYIPRLDILEERTYSLKSLPPGYAKGRHSIERMMKTANRLVQICDSWDKRSGHGKTPCWKKEAVLVVEPLSSSLLEECFVDGLGKFTAFTNGRVRVVFEDRTSLDMMADFSSRLGHLNQVQQNVISVKKESGGTETARLLVPSGNYVMVEVNRPEHYAKYLRAAKEWIAWVNASQAERHNFYKQQNQPHVLQQAAQLELKKIFCFNYILEHSGIPTHEQIIQKSSITVAPNHCQKTTSKLSSSSISSSSLVNPTTLYDQHHSAFAHNILSHKSNLESSTSAHPPPAFISSSSIADVKQSSNSAIHPVLSRDYSSSRQAQSTLPYQPHVLFAEDKCGNTTMGFQSVRSALARTSSLINDIEMFLEENKT